MKFSVIGVSDKKWAYIISKSFQYDFYHSQSYSLLETAGKPLLCTAYDDDNFIALPLVLRKIEQTNFYDCTSVYGYCGPVSNLPPEKISTELIKFFHSELLGFFSKTNIVSAFSRLHPFFNQFAILNGLGTVKELHKTVAIDLRLAETDQIKGYRKSTKFEIKQLRKKGFTVSEVTLQDQIDEFAGLYYESMKIKNADRYLLFDKEYFHRFLSSKDFKAILLTATKEGEMTAGAIFTLTDKIMQYHLACSREKYMKYAPMKLIIDQARLVGIEHKMEYLHLGGGVSSSPEDSLFKFKAGFSDARFSFNTWQLIVDKKKYDYLIDLFRIEVDNEIDYFPIYRSK